MHNHNHSIDQQMREVLDQGTERLNLGAWANMERMLDGQNPYAAPEQEDKKRGFWLFGLLAMVIGMIGLGAYQLLHTTKPAPSMVQITPTDKVVKSSNTTQSTTVVPNNEPPAIEPTSESIETPPILQSSSPIPIGDAGTNKESNFTVTQTINNTNNNSSTAPNHNNNGVTNITKHSDKTINKNANNNLENQQPETTLPNANLVNKKDKNASKIVWNNENIEEIAADSKVKEIKNETIGNKTIAEKSDVKEIKIKKENNNKVQAVETNTKIESSIVNKTDKADKQISKPKDSTTLIRKTLSTSKNEDGIVIDKVKVSVSKAEKINTSDKTTTVNEEAITVVNNIEKTTKPIENKRSVQLSIADQEKADAKPSAVIVKKKKMQVEEVIEKVVANQTVPTQNNAIPKEESKAKAKSVDASNWATKAIENIVETAKKFGYLPIFNQKIYVNPGIFGGVNGSFFKTEHNYGGFQTGANLMMQIAKNWSILPSLGFYYRNNGGYSIKDNSTVISNKSSYISTDFKSNIYNFQLDSSTVNYNFKHTYSLELPIVLQYHRKDFAFYGGINIAYGFKMNTNIKTTLYTNQSTVSMPIDSAYAYPNSVASYYKSSDFQSRFGLGYVAGFSYDFHPNLYFDARITKNIWDNSGTTSAIAMSNKMFRVPSIQLGISYRFKERERARY